MTEPAHYRVGRSQPRNLYRHVGDNPDGVYIGVCFDPDDTRMIVAALNARQALLNLCANAEQTGRLIHHEQIYQLLTTDPGDAT